MNLKRCLDGLATPYNAQGEAIHFTDVFDTFTEAVTWVVDVAKLIRNSTGVVAIYCVSYKAAFGTVKRHMFRPACEGFLMFGKDVELVTEIDEACHAEHASDSQDGSHYE